MVVYFDEVCSLIMYVTGCHVTAEAEAQHGYLLQGKLDGKNVFSTRTELGKLVVAEIHLFTTPAG